MPDDNVIDINPIIAHIKEMGLKPVVYEYAGFNYYVLRDPKDRLFLVPLEGQHPAAAKPKHCIAARECYLQDHKATVEPLAKK